MSLPLRMLVLVSCAAAACWAASAQGPQSTLEIHVAAARAARAQANCSLAAQEYHAAVQLLPSSGELRTNEGIALYCASQLEPAITTLRGALHANASLNTPHLFLGLASFRLGRLDAARQELTLYLKQAPADVTAHLWLGYTLAAQNRQAEARAELKQVLALKPADPDALYALGESALDAAHDRARELEALDPSGVKLLKLAAEHYRAEGNEEQAHAAEAEAAKRYAAAGSAPRDSVKAAKLVREVEAFQAEALAAFQQILQTAPDSFRAHEVRGDALLASHQDEAALTEYEEVLRLNPNLPGIHEIIGECLVATGHITDALAAFNEERKLSPVASASLLTRIGQAERTLGNNEEAAASLHTAIQRTDAPPQAWLLLAQVELEQSHADEAVRLLQHFLQLHPDSSTAYYDLSRAYRMLGNRNAMAQAITDYKRTSADAKARGLMAQVTGESAMSSVADNPQVTQADSQPSPQP